MSYATYSDEDLHEIAAGERAAPHDLAEIVLYLRKQNRDLDDRGARDRLRWRHVEDPCEACSGAGVRAYGNSSTWRGGMGATAITVDVCDTCWGTGDRFRRGLDLRALRNEERDRIAKAAATALIDSCGAQWETSAPSIVAIIQHLEKLVDGRTRPPAHFTTGSLAQGLANLLRRAVGTPERKL